MKEEFGEVILERLAAGETLRAICRTDGYPAPATVVEWQNKCPAYAEQYARARREGLDVMADQIVDIADDMSRDPNDRRVAVDSRKWLLSKLRPDKYGDRVTTELTGPGGGPVQMAVSLADVIRDRRQKREAEGVLELPAGALQVEQ